MNIAKFLMKHFGLTKRPNPTYKQYFTFGELQRLLIDYDQAITVTPCCAELKCDKEKLAYQKGWHEAVKAAADSMGGGM